MKRPKCRQSSVCAVSRKDIFSTPITILLIISTSLAATLTSFALPQQQQQQKSQTVPDIQANEDTFAEPNGTLQLKCQLSPAILASHAPAYADALASSAGENALYQWRFIPTEAAESRRGREISLATLGASGEWKAYDDLIITGQRRRGEFNLDVVRVSYAQNDGDYYCEINMPGGQVYQSSKFRVYVKYAPSAPHITYSGVGAKSFIEGEKLLISCASEGGNPPPQISWYRGDERLESVYKMASTRHGESAAQLVLDPLAKQHNGVQYKCVVKNAALERGLSAETQPLDVKYKPRVTVAGYVLDPGVLQQQQPQSSLPVKGPFNPLEIERGTPFRIACAVDANPPINSPWWRRAGKIVYSNHFNVTFDKNSLTTTGSDSNAVEVNGPLECVAQNSIGESSALLDIRVFTSPAVQLSPRSSTVKEGENTTFDCTVTSNPSVTSDAVEWYRGTQKIATGRNLTLTDIHRSQAGEYRCRAQNRFRTSGATTTVTRDGEASSRLVVQHRPGAAAIKVSSAQDRTYAADSTALLNDEDVGLGTGAGSETLNPVSIAAGANKSTSNSNTVTTLMGAQVSLFCTTDESGVPQATYRWTKRGEPGFRTTGQYLNFSRAALQQNGAYECMPSNEVGEGVPQTIQLVVNEPVTFESNQPNIGNEVGDASPSDSSNNMLETLVQSINSEEPVSLQCTARGKPAPVIEWLRNGRLISNSPTSSLLGKFRAVTDEPKTVDTFSYIVKSELRFEGDARRDLFSGSQRLSRTDRGVYTCRARGAGPIREQNRTVLIQYPPELRNRFNKAATTLLDNLTPTQTKSASPESNTNEARIPCLIEARPAPAVTWTRNGNAIIGATDGRVYVQPLVAVDDETYRSELVIRQPTRDDLGDYICAAKNMIAEKQFPIALTERSKPQSPTALEASHVFYSSLLLRWTPGFDGGYAQKFSVHMVEPKELGTAAGDENSLTKNSKIFHPSPDSASWLLVTGLKSETTLTFWIESENELGPSAGRSNVVRVKTHQAPIESLNVPPPKTVQFDAQLALVKFDLSASTASTLSTVPTELGANKFSTQAKPPPLCANIELLFAHQDDWSTVAECYDSFTTDAASPAHKTSGAFEVGLLQDDFIQLGAVENVRVRMCLAQAPPTSCSKPTYWRADGPLFGTSKIAGGFGAGGLTVLTVILCVLAALAMLFILAFFACRRSTTLHRHFKKHINKSTHSNNGTPIDNSSSSRKSTLVVNNSDGTASHLTPSISAPTALLGGGVKPIDSNGMYGIVGHHQHHDTFPRSGHSPLPNGHLAAQQQQSRYYQTTDDNGHLHQLHNGAMYGHDNNINNGMVLLQDDQQNNYPNDVYQAYSGAVSAYPVQVSPQPNGLPANNSAAGATFYYDDGSGGGPIAGGTVVVDENGEELLIDDEGNYHRLHPQHAWPPNLQLEQQQFMANAQQQHWQNGNNVHNMSYYPVNHHQYNNAIYNSHQLNGLPDPYDDDAATFLTHVPAHTNNNNINNNNMNSNNVDSNSSSNSHINSAQVRGHGLPVVVIDANGTTTTATTSAATTIKTPSFGEASDESGYSTSASRNKRVVREIVV